MGAKKEHLKELIGSDMARLKLTHGAQIEMKLRIERDIDRFVADQDSVECKVLGLQLS